MDKQAIRTELMELENQFWQALKDKDVDAAMRLTNDPCIITGAQGIGRVDRKSFEAMMKAMPYTLDDYQVNDVQVEQLTDDVAVVAYKVHEHVTIQGSPVSLDAADSSTWVRRDGRWLCAVHTEAIAGDPFGRDRQTAR
jgi:uncharacterized protein (TIGR02246 family)